METLETLRKRCTVPDCIELRADQSEDATNRHCKKHRAEAQKRHAMTKVEQTGARSWHEGVTAMAELLAKNFEVYKIQRFSGPEIADIIRRCERPKFGESSLASEAAS